MAFGSFDEGGSGQPMAEINTTPLVDVMLVLLVIFIITAPLFQQAVPIDLPQVSATKLDDKPEVIQLAVDGDGHRGARDALVAHLLLQAGVDGGEVGVLLDRFGSGRWLGRSRLEAGRLSDADQDGAAEADGESEALHGWVLGGAWIVGERTDAGDRSRVTPAAGGSCRLSAGAAARAGSSTSVRTGSARWERGCRWGPRTDRRSRCSRC